MKRARVKWTANSVEDVEQIEEARSMVADFLEMESEEEKRAYASSVIESMAGRMVAFCKLVVSLDRDDPLFDPLMRFFDYLLDAFQPTYRSQSGILFTRDFMEAHHMRMKSGVIQFPIEIQWSVPPQPFADPPTPGVVGNVVYPRWNQGGEIEAEIPNDPPSQSGMNWKVEEI
jgi:hypothetical protein